MRQIYQMQSIGIAKEKRKWAGTSYLSISGALESLEDCLCTPGSVLVRVSSLSLAVSVCSSVSGSALSLPDGKRSGEKILLLCHT